MQQLDNFDNLEVWFVTGSQHLYGPETLETVAQHSARIAEALAEASSIPVRIVPKPVLTGPDEIRRLMQAANADERCVGLITWMHTFSPAKMWIAGLGALQKPFLHLHTQFDSEIPWSTIDMDFMNLNQAAYDVLYREYVRLHDYFGRGENDVMKTLKGLRARARAGQAG